MWCCPLPYSHRACDGPMMLSINHRIMNEWFWTRPLYSSLCPCRPTGWGFLQAAAPLSDPRSGRCGWASLSGRGLNFVDFVQKTGLFFLFLSSPLKQLCRLFRILTCSHYQHATIQRDGPTQVHTRDYYKSFIYPGLSDRGLEGDMGEDRSHLLVPDFPLPAACRWDDINAEEPKGKRLQMVKWCACMLIRKCCNNNVII